MFNETMYLSLPKIKTLKQVYFAHTLAWPMVSLFGMQPTNLILETWIHCKIKLSKFFLELTGSQVPNLFTKI